MHSLIPGFIAAKYDFGHLLVLKCSKASCLLWISTEPLRVSWSCLSLLAHKHSACSDDQYIYECATSSLFTLATKKFLLFWCSVLGIYKCTFTHKKLGITKEQLAGKVLPHLIPLSIENNLNLNQVGAQLFCMLFLDNYLRINLNCWHKKVHSLLHVCVYCENKP